MNSIAPSLLAEFAQLLAQREAQWRAALEKVEHGMPESEGQHEVSDFKDLASEQASAQLDKSQADRLRQSLQQTVAARQRLAENRYAQCQDCGQPIDLRRLQALPETPCCAPCQARRESARQHGQSVLSRPD